MTAVPRQSGRADTVLVVTGVALVVSSIVGPLWLAVSVIANTGGWLPGVSITGVTAVALGWSSGAVTAKRATGRWVVATVAIVVTIAALVALCITTPIDFQLGTASHRDAANATSGGVSPEAQTDVMVTVDYAAAWIGAFYLLKLLPWWGAVAQRAASSGRSRWWIGAATAPIWASAIGAIVSHDLVGFALAVASTAWLLCALRLRRQAMAQAS